MHLVVLVTTPSVKEAEQIAQELLEKRLAALYKYHTMRSLKIFVERKD